MVTSQQRVRVSAVTCVHYTGCSTVMTLTSLGNRQTPFGVGNPQSDVIPLSQGLFGFTHFAVLNDDLNIQHKQPETGSSR